MNPADETLIETYVWRPDALSDAERDRAQALVRHDPEAREWAEALRAFYDVLSDDQTVASDSASSPTPASSFTAGTQGPPVVDAFVDDLFAAPGAIPLRPKPAPESRTVLAADGGKDRFRLLTCLASPEAGVLVRVLLDTERGEGRFYALAQDASVPAHALLDLPGAPAPIPLRADGTAVCPLEEGLPEEAPATGTLHRCLWDGQVPRSGPLPGPIALPSGRPVHLERPAPATIRVRTERPSPPDASPADAPPVPAWVGLFGEDLREIRSLTKDRVDLPIPTGTGPVTLRLFG